MAKSKKKPQNRVRPAAPKRRFDPLTVVALIGVAAALAVSLANQQRMKRIEERLGARPGSVGVESNPIGDELNAAPNLSLPSPAAALPEIPVDDAYSSVDESFTPVADSSPAGFVGVQPVGSRQPDADIVYSIRTEGAPVRGAVDAPVTIVEFSDFQCSFCRRAKPTVERILEVYGDQVRLVWKHLPLSMHEDAPTAHVASVAAAKQGRFWEFHDKLFENSGNLKQDDLRLYASDVGLSMQAFEQGFDDDEARSIVQADMAEAVAMDLTATPGFFINGRYLRGAKPFEDFAALINAELESLGLPVPEAARVE